ncbi:MAG: hypothetical protein EAX90_14255 [Candidatus Heimdallarchaeota archaeon]|nr:hypothetical protein [Candidatus Heimdallarchaeota archaeon]
MVQLGTNGFDIIKVYPEVLSKNLLTEISIKSMPFGAKNGDFTTTTVARNNTISSYVFSSPSNQFRDNVASIIAIYSNMEYNPELIHQIFSLIINKIKETDKDIITTVSNNLENIFRGFSKDTIKIKLESNKNVELKLDRLLSSKTQKVVKSFKDDIWA